jgi:NTP pyrophosphatase (non-canonical NTP hydrolase)
MISRPEVMSQIARELERAYSKHGREKWGRHEFYGVLREEMDELWDAIRGDDNQEQVIKEAIQVASMVFRYLETGDRYREKD